MADWPFEVNGRWRRNWQSWQVISKLLRFAGENVVRLEKIACPLDISMDAPGLDAALN